MNLVYIIPRCHCAESQNLMPSELTQDYGYFTSMADLPVMGISLSGTDFEGIQFQYHTLGPLECFQCKSKDI